MSGNIWTDTDPEDADQVFEDDDKETLIESALTFKSMGWESESRAITRAVARLAEKDNEIERLQKLMLEQTKLNAKVISERDSWRRVAERLERERLFGIDARISQGHD